MLLDHVDSPVSRELQWKCLGCGRGFRYDPGERQNNDTAVAGLNRPRPAPRLG